MFQKDEKHLNNKTQATIIYVIYQWSCSWRVKPSWFANPFKVSKQKWFKNFKQIIRRILNLLFVSKTELFMYSFIHISIHCLFRLSRSLFIYSCIRSCIHPFPLFTQTLWFTRLIIHSFAHSVIDHDSRVLARSTYAKTMI